MRNISGGRVYGRVLAQAWSTSQSGRWFSSSIRRSREERKAMIESFVKEYKRSNNGRFPPITVILKEVGGRFYIVRHILQELKVTWTPDQGSQTGPADEFPRGAISETPQSSASLSPNGTVPESDEHPRLDGEGEHHPSNGTSTASKQEVIENSIHGREFPSSIRHSREERKTIIESFVMEYKESNNGSFPPINVIQKEVGGGFHVVRHILQELKATWSQNQGSQTGPSDEFSRGKISKKPRSSASLMKGTVPVSDDHSRLDGEEEHHPISNGISGASKQEVIEDPIDDDLINVENVDSDESEVVAGTLSGGSSEGEHLIGGKTFDMRNDTEIEGSGRSLENMKHAEELPKVVVSTPSLENQNFVEPITVIEKRAPEGSVVPKENTSVETITVPTNDREEKVELDTRNKGSRSDKDGSVEQPCIKSNKVETVVHNTSEILDVTSSNHQQTGTSNNVQHRSDALMEERRAEVVPVEKAKTIGSSLKSFVVNAFMKLWS